MRGATSGAGVILCLPTVKRLPEKSISSPRQARRMISIASSIRLGRYLSSRPKASN
jgi:hypothetical protein